MVAESEKVSDRVHPMESEEGEIERWEPTEDEVGELGDFIDFSALIDCGPDGCATEDDEPPPGS